MIEDQQTGARAWAVSGRERPFNTSLLLALGLVAAAAFIWTRERRSEADVDRRTASRLGVRP